ncbi:ubiquitin-like [Aphis gossypii]|uniref:ubiquitin-like n=1 Tax=Aphis gossypii TaxID=80765 RepID=UPI0021592D2A|nr:ubiquitin-like [Aphis gossypii]
MSQQGQADQIQELTTSDTPRTADRDRIDRTVEVQEMLRTSSPPSGTIERMYREPQSHTMNKTGKIQIVVKFLTDRTITLEVVPSETIGNLKSKIQQIDGLKSYRQHLIFNGEQLKDHCKLSDYKVQDMTIIYLVLR